MVNSYDVAILSEKVARLEALLAAGGVSLPEVSASDNGATLQVVNGAWAKGDEIPAIINALDSTSTTDGLSAAQGKVLNDKIEAIGGTIYKKHIQATTDANGIITSDLSTSDYIYIGTNMTASLITLPINALSDSKIRIKVINSSDFTPVTNTGLDDDFYFIKLD